MWPPGSGGFFASWTATWTHGTFGALLSTPESCQSVPHLQHGLVEAGWSDWYPLPRVCSFQCGRHQGILQLVCSFIERTFMATSSDAHMATELGYLFILQDQVKEASLWYSKAMKLDESSVAALTGLGRLGRERGGRLAGGSQAG